MTVGMFSREGAACNAGKKLTDKNAGYLGIVRMIVGDAREFVNLTCVIDVGDIGMVHSGGKPGLSCRS
ncbi:MAG TPA: hypothetical protein VNM92_14170 [Thermoanaerobaculia bacterium]|nr:hypothetical protein [Thermoanaerobaculia bacterium]